MFFQVLRPAQEHDLTDQVKGQRRVVGELDRPLGGLEAGEAVREGQDALGRGIEADVVGVAREVHQRATYKIF